MATAAPKTRADLVTCNIPGFRVVFFKSKNDKGEAIVTQFTLPDIDAVDAVKRFPKEYFSEDPGAAAGDLVEGPSIHDPFLAAEGATAPASAAPQETPKA